MKLIKIIRKDLKLLLRSRISSLIVIFGPLAVMFLVGVAFDNSNQYSINVGVYSASYSELTESFIGTLKENNFRVSKEGSQDDCIRKIKQGSLHICIVFPPDLKIENDASNEVVFYADYSKVNLVWSIVETLSSRISSRSNEISLDLTEELLSRIDEAKAEADKNMGLVASLKETAGKMDEQVSRIMQQIEDTGLTISAQESNSTSIKESVHAFKEDTFARVAIIRDNLDTIRIKVEGSGNLSSEEKEPMVKLVNVSGGELLGIEHRLQAALNITDFNYEQMALNIEHIRYNLDNMQNLAGTDDDSLRNEIAASLAVLSELESGITGLQASLGSIKVTDAENIANPIVTKIQPVLAEKTHLSYIYSNLLVFVIMFVSLLLTTTIVMMERTSPSFFRNFISPTKDLTFIAATFLSSFIIVFFQVVIILSISAIFFDSPILSNLGNTAAMLLLVIALFILLGMLIGYAFNSQETAIMGSISLGSLLLLLSGMILPLESMPSYLLKIAAFNPFVIAESVLRKTILFSSSLNPLLPEIMLLAGYTAIFFLLVLLFQKLSKHNLHITAYRSTHERHLSASGISRLIARAEKAVRKKNRDEAKRLYTEAIGIYNELNASNNPKMPALYEKLNKLKEKF